MKLNVTLNHEGTIKRFQKIKKHYDLKYNKSLVELLLSNEAKRIRKEDC